MALTAYEQSLVDRGTPIPETSSVPQAVKDRVNSAIASKSSAPSAVQNVRSWFEANPGKTDAEIAAAAREYNISPELISQATGVNVADVTQRLNLANSQRVALDSPSGLVPASEIPISTAQTPGATPTSMFDTALDYMKFAAEGTKGLTSYTPTDVTAGTLPQVDISQYMNPYTQEVIDQSLADLERQRLMQQQQTSAQAAAAGAFGGSRQGVAQALTNEAFARQAGQLSSGLRQAGFTQAQQAAQTDLARQMQAQQLNQAAGLQGAQFQLGAQQQLGGMGLTGYNLAQQQYQQFMANEAQKQAMQNQLYGQQASQFQSFFGQPAQSLGYVSSALGAAPVPQTTTASMQPGLFNYLTLGAMMYPGSRVGV